MILTEEKYIKSISMYLGVLSEYIETLSYINLNDASVISENLCARLMNLVYGYKLENANLIRQNADVIDLYDPNEKVAVQVTSNRRLTKVRTCLSNFLEKDLDKEYRELYIYILTSKQRSYQIETIHRDEFNFNKKIHIIDKKNIISKIQGLSPVLQKEILELLKNNINLPEESVTVSNEVATIINLVTLISENEAKSQFDSNTDIDPRKKITKRFKDKAILVDNQYFNLCQEYLPVLVEVESNDTYDGVKNSKVSLYLKDKSTELLLKYDFDALQALNDLISHVEHLFQIQSVEYNETAIKFFILKHLTECNVFPMLRGEERSSV
ncbi:SMEK domain-containing protein [Vibrio vulnificus]|uniref:SMEK domain-containing protein n=1 Tax=Vibrio vulnificus TaxID=672 RepID=UPI003EDA6600